MMHAIFEGELPPRPSSFQLSSPHQILIKRSDNIMLTKAFFYLNTDALPQKTWLQNDFVLYVITAKQMPCSLRMITVLASWQASCNYALTTQNLLINSMCIGHLRIASIYHFVAFPELMDVLNYLWSANTVQTNTAYWCLWVVSWFKIRTNWPTL